MLAVAAGHWIAMTLSRDSAGVVSGRNALELRPQLPWITWVLQVMPLFFVVGGYASAMSLDKHTERAGRGAAWVADRLRRMCWPASVLAALWFAVLALTAATPARSIAAAAAAGASIPLWFLANYTIDIAAAPLLRPRFKAHPARTAAALVGVYGAVELLSAAGVPAVHEVNWVCGWLLFQLVGYAWYDGHIRPGRISALAAAALGMAALAAVTWGPWPVSMIHIAGMTHSPTHPPSVALMLFGLAYSLAAITLTPALNRALADRPSLRRAVNRLGAVSMTVYLYHMTAAMVVAGAQYAAGIVDPNPVGSAGWWLMKIPTIAANTFVLVVLIGLFGRFELAGLVHAKQGWKRSSVAMAATAAAISLATKGWASGNAALMAVGTAVLVVVSVGVLGVRLTARADRAVLAAAVV